MNGLKEFRQTAFDPDVSLEVVDIFASALAAVFTMFSIGQLVKTGGIPWGPLAGFASTFLAFSTLEYLGNRKWNTPANYLLGAVAGAGAAFLYWMVAMYLAVAS